MIIAAALTLGSCKASGNSGNDKASPAPGEDDKLKVEFVADSALEFLSAQCRFGPRVPGTQAHSRCAEYLKQQLTLWTDTVVTQSAPITTFDGKTFNAINIMGRINTDAATRILLLAHWDCRPWADKDEDPAMHHTPVMGANDAASGVAVLMELARIMSNNKPGIGIGVDLLMVDAEDWGSYDNEDSWALGTRLWASNHKQLLGQDYAPTFGILLDMVGARGARFAPEYFSTQYAPGVVKLVWDTAREAGYGSYFVQSSGGAVTDDHVVVNTIASIPCIDIIDMRGDGFFEHWHTSHDTINDIDAATLKAVGQTLTRLIYNY